MEVLKVISLNRAIITDVGMARERIGKLATKDGSFATGIVSFHGSHLEFLMDLWFTRGKPPAFDIDYSSSPRQVASLCSQLSLPRTHVLWIALEETLWGFWDAFTRTMHHNVYHMRIHNEISAAALLPGAKQRWSKQVRNGCHAVNRIQLLFNEGFKNLNE